MLIDYILAFGKAVASTVNSKTGATLYQISGVGSMNPDAADDGTGADEDGELIDEMPGFSALGVIFRQLGKTVVGGRTYETEVVCMRTSDGLVPIAWRDLRLHAAFPDGLAEGQIAFAGYGKGFYSLSLTADGEANIHVIYCPYDFDSAGVAQKAHAIVLDPDEGLSIVHGDGYAMTMSTSAGLVLRSETGEARIIMQGDTITHQASKHILQGNVAVGANPASAVPLLPGAASPPCPSLWLSPV